MGWQVIWLIFGSFLPLGLIIFFIIKICDKT